MKRSDPPSPDDGHDDRAIHAQLTRLRAEQERLFSQLQAGEHHFKQLARSVWRVQEDERRRLARELHDGIGQNLTALRHRLESLARDGTVPEGHVDLARAMELCERALEETRTLSRLLRPQILDDLGLAAALRWLTRSAGETFAGEIELDLEQLPESLDPDLSTLIFRVTQEALNNALKHAQARHIIVRVARRANLLTLLIVDDGRGCDIEAALSAGTRGLSTGLSSMRERVRLFGGQFQVSSTPGEGVQIRAVIPMSAGESSP